MNTNPAIVNSKSSKPPIRHSIKRKVLFAFMMLAILAGGTYFVFCIRYNSLINSLEKAADNEYISENSNEPGGMTYYSIKLLQRQKNRN